MSSHARPVTIRRYSHRQRGRGGLTPRRTQLKGPTIRRPAMSSHASKTDTRTPALNSHPGPAKGSHAPAILPAPVRFDPAAFPPVRVRHPDKGRRCVYPKRRGGGLSGRPAMRPREARRFLSPSRAGYPATPATKHLESPHRAKVSAAPHTEAPRKQSRALFVAFARIFYFPNVTDPDDYQNFPPGLFVAFATFSQHFFRFSSVTDPDPNRLYIQKA